MRLLRAIVIAGVCFVSQASCAGNKQNTTKLFLMEDAGSSQWCAFDKEPNWSSTVQEVEAMAVGALTYSNDHLSRIDVTETDESGDWIVYDNYFIDNNGYVIRLSRLINVLPDDRSVSQTFSIIKERITQTAMTERVLGSGKLLISPKPVWLPDLPIRASLKQFPFSGLLSRPSVGTAGKVCLKNNS